MRLGFFALLAFLSPIALFLGPGWAIDSLTVHGARRALEAGFDAAGVNLTVDSCVIYTDQEVGHCIVVGAAAELEAFERYFGWSSVAGSYESSPSCLSLPEFGQRTPSAGFRTTKPGVGAHSDRVGASAPRSVYPFHTVFREPTNRRACVQFAYVIG
ncbi:MAG TPA: hypothetical protein PKA88_23095 [Polyangiaceae bacterium]|nr:hypothetical protein [Polyangiaceae bacterium]HMR74570.1 hypothetical protein [Polyangiaceae bacterium]